MARIDGKWQVVDWQRAFALVTAGLQKIIAEHGAEHIGALASPSATLEEFYLLQKVLRGLGSSHIDHRLREMDTSDQDHMPAFPGLSMSLTELEQCDAIILIGSNLQKEQPLAALRLRKAINQGAAVLVINPVDYRFNFHVTAKKIIAPSQFLAAVNDFEKTFAQHLQNKTKVAVIVGALAMHHAQAAAIRYAAQQIAETYRGKLNLMTDGANSAGAWLAGAVPHRAHDNAASNGLSAYAMLQNPRKAYLLLNVEPALDCANPSQAVAALKQAQFVVALTSYHNPALTEHADVILPMAAFTETSGTFVNAMGEWQSFTGAAKAYHAARPAWKILRVLGNFLHLAGFGYESSEEIKHEVKALAVEKLAVNLPRPAASTGPAMVTTDNTLSRIGEIPIYAIDSIVRRAQPLQQAQTIMQGDVAAARMHPNTAKRLQLAENAIVTLKQHNNTVQMPLILDPRIAEDAIWVAGGIAQTCNLGDLFGMIEVQKNRHCEEGVSPTKQSREI
jgi:NADH-quinone oxidoreductase subunit G